ncbi:MULTISPECIES: efflux transporter outer membrane subunit [unclassified Thioalkalivibrio]|uniref:efflux transporter outer membrane subunit n=1 Tax=unclassified Thioalkalivibrio TaxID=2621013 RepID=UPI00037E3F5A|nr:MULTISPECIES: efflux transporter outer membrane subunit [unclassified Thioalkalivibrio]
MRKLLSLAATTILITGCAVGPEYERPETDLPDEWPEHELFDTAEDADWQEWWTHFDDPELDDLVERALGENLDVRLQAERVMEAHARLGLADAERMPTVDAQAEAARERQPEATSPLPGTAGTGNLFSVSGMLGYELDLWGRLASQREAAEAMLLESAFSRDAVRLNVATDVVTTYISLRAAEEQLVLTEETVRSRQRSLYIEEARYEEGSADALAVRQARSDLEATRASLPPMREQVMTLESALAVLVGAQPGELLGELDFGEGRLRELGLPDAMPEDTPADILRRRPDIRAAEAGLMASTAEIGIAEANRLPQVRLSAVLGTAATATGDLFTGPSETWGLGASVGGPLFDFGRSRAQVETAESLRAQAETQYNITVTTAFREVRDALIAYDMSSDRIEAVGRQLEAIEDTRDMSQLQYDEGLTGRFELLDAERALLEAELTAVEAARDRLTATATLFKAMGGAGWEGHTAHVFDAEGADAR